MFEGKSLLARAAVVAPPTTMEDPTPSSSNKSRYRDWLELPREITISIFQRLGVVEIHHTLPYVCVTWRNIYKDSIFQSTSIDMSKLGYPRPSDSTLEQLCHQAISLSSCNLAEIVIESFATDKLLHHIAESTTGLKRLRLVHCSWRVGDKALCKLAAKAPLLEELELSHCLFSERVVEVIGRCCPLLRSFKLNSCWVSENEKTVVAVGRHMPGLRHLQIVGNHLSNDELLDILDGCPHLESLDLRQCFNIVLEGDVEERCIDRIKELWRPDDSTHDYPYKSLLFYSPEEPAHDDSYHSPEEPIYHDTDTDTDAKFSEEEGDDDDDDKDDLSPEEVDKLKSIPSTSPFYFYSLKSVPVKNSSQTSTF